MKRFSNEVTIHDIAHLCINVVRIQKNSLVGQAACLSLLSPACEPKPRSRLFEFSLAIDLTGLAGIGKNTERESI